MAKRSATGAIAHEKGIYLEAINLRRQGWFVLADHIPGFQVPPEIEGVTPDIYAMKGEETLIVEVETNGNDDLEQHKTLGKYACNFTSVKFQVAIVNAAGIKVSSNEFSECSEEYAG